MRTIHYISFYLNQSEIDDRELVVPVQSKVSYIIDAIKKSGFCIQVVSTALANTKTKFSRKKNITIDPSETHIYLSAIGSKSAFLRKFRSVYMQMKLFLYLMRNINKNDVIIFYHSLSYMKVIKLFNKIRKNKIILELNDLYALHFTSEKSIFRIKKKELSLFKIPDSFIFASPFMTDLIEIQKPFILSYGSYKKVQLNHKNDDKKIHIIYSGVIENLRNAANLAAYSAKYLTEDFIIHIAGYGNDENVNKFIALCDLINKEIGREGVIFHGLLMGSEFDLLLNKCKIALNCHSYTEIDLWKSKYSFPSKIPLNMSYDLYLVSHNMDVISKSPFAEFCTFYNNFTPEAIASAIIESSKKINNNIKNIYTPKDLIKNLDDIFVDDLKNLINDL